MTGMTSAGVHLQRQVRRLADIILRPTIRFAYCTRGGAPTFSTNTINATTAIMPATRRITTARGVKRSPLVCHEPFYIEVADAARQAHDNTGEDHQRHAVADAALRDLLTQPHDERGAGGQGKDAHGRNAAARMVTMFDGAAGRQGDGGRLHDASRTVRSRVHWVILRRPSSPSSVAGQRLTHDRHQLKDDRRSDVRHDAKGENREAAEIAAGEEVDHASTADPGSA